MALKAKKAKLKKAKSPKRSTQGADEIRPAAKGKKASHEEVAKPRKLYHVKYEYEHLVEKRQQKLRSRPLRYDAEVNVAAKDLSHAMKRVRDEYAPSKRQTRIRFTSIHGIADIHVD